MANIKGREKKTGQIDFILLLIIIVMLLFGLLMLFSASSPRALKTGSIYSAIIKQAGVAAVGFIIMMSVANIPYMFWIKKKRMVMIITYVLMFVVPFIGFASHGARRQISLGFISFQPSEIAKFALVIYYASRFSSAKTSDIAHDGKNLAKSLVPVIILIAACILQSHLSAIIMLVMITAVMLITAGLPIKYMFILGGCGAAGIGTLAVTASYRLNRIKAMWNPFKYSRGIGWQIIQSLYAVGSGGLFGLGLGQSRQKYYYLPEAHNDYIFAVICEELGFIGGAFVIILFALFIRRGISIALHADTKTGMYTAFGITSVIGLQMLINVGVVLNVVPSTGMQLPFFSAGGTSLIVTLGAMGILLNISKTSKVKKI